MFDRVQPDAIRVLFPLCLDMLRAKGALQQSFHTMLSATAIADGHNRVRPLMPKFVQPQQDPAASQPQRTEQARKQDCERSAAKRWLLGHFDKLRPYRPVFLGDDRDCW